MQLVQLMQYVKIESFSIVISNKVLNVLISSNNVRAYQSLGFDTTSFNDDDESFSFGIRKPIGTSTYSMNVDILIELLQFLKVFSNSEVNKESISSIWDQHLENRKTHNVISARLMKIAGSATVIPLSIVTKMMNQCFVKLKYLESMLELLQQFYLQLVLVR